MKIFTIKRVLGAAAIYGAVLYARKHGGAKNAFNELLGKAKDVTATVSNAPSPGTPGNVSSESERNTGGASSSAYTDSVGLSGNGTKNHS
jgi:hypothetical protein